MKKFLVLMPALFFLTSCVVLSPKKYKGILAQRDSLSTSLTNANTRIDNLEEEVFRLKSDTTLLHSQIADLNGKVQGLNSNNANLRAASTRLNDDLKKREARLKEVEDILRKRDEASLALKDKLQKALLGFQQNGLAVDIRDGKVYVSLTDKLLFSSGSIIIDERGKQALSGLAAVLQSQPEINISVEGHTDNQKVFNLGQIKDNWDLSVLRATSVARFLTVNERIDSKRITATGKGDTQPLDDNGNADGRSRNRRIEIVLSPKLDDLYNLIK